MKRWTMRDWPNQTISIPSPQFPTAPSPNDAAPLSASKDAGNRQPLIGLTVADSVSHSAKS